MNFVPSLYSWNSLLAIALCLFGLLGRFLLTLATALPYELQDLRTLEGEFFALLLTWICFFLSLYLLICSLLSPYFMFLLYCHIFPPLFSCKVYFLFLSFKNIHTSIVLLIMFFDLLYVQELYLPLLKDMKKCAIWNCSEPLTQIILIIQVHSKSLRQTLKVVRANNKEHFLLKNLSLLTCRFEVNIDFC